MNELQKKEMQELARLTREVNSAIAACKQDSLVLFDLLTTAEQKEQFHKLIKQVTGPFFQTALQLGELGGRVSERRGIGEDISDSINEKSKQSPNDLTNL